MEAEAEAEKRLWSAVEDTILVATGLPPKADHKARVPAHGGRRGSRRGCERCVRAMQAVRMLFLSWRSAAVPSVALRSEEDDDESSTSALVQFGSESEASEALRVMDHLPLVSSYVLRLQRMRDASPSTSLSVVTPADSLVAQRSDSSSCLPSHCCAPVSFEDALRMFAGRRLLLDMLTSSEPRAHHANGALLRLLLPHGHACAVLLCALSLAALLLPFPLHLPILSALCSPVSSCSARGVRPKL